MPSRKRLYSGKAVEMLTVLDLIVESAIANKEALIAKRKTWADPFFSDLQNRIQVTTDEYFGIDAADLLREATAIISDMQDKTLKDLSFFKLQFEEDFKKDKAFVDRTLNKLGFDDYYEQVKSKSQEALVQLLYQFKQNLSDELKTKIVEKGIDEDLINGFLANSETLHKANVTQELYKGKKKITSEEASNQFNELYSEVISVAKIAARIFQDQPAIADSFNYTKTLTNLTGTASASTKAKKAKAAKALETI